MASIHATISEELKNRLDEHIENTPYLSNRSEFVRRAVHEKLERDGA